MECGVCICGVVCVGMCGVVCMCVECGVRVCICALYNVTDNYMLYTE